MLPQIRDKPEGNGISRFVVGLGRVVVDYIQDDFDSGLVQSRRNWQERLLAERNTYAATISLNSVAAATGPRPSVANRLIGLWKLICE